jgi:hypothetical protein
MAGDVGWMECGALGDANGKEESKGGWLAHENVQDLEHM